MNQRTIVICLAVILSGLEVNDSQAATINWNNPLGGSFENPGNWSPFGPPTFGIDVCFNLPNTYTVNFGTSANSGSLTVLAGNVSFLLSSGFSYEVFGDVNIGAGVPMGSTVTLSPLLGPFSVSGNINVLDMGVLSPDTATIAAAEVAIQQGGQLRGTSTIQSNVINLGLVAPGSSAGNSPGTVNVTGNFTQDTTGVLEIEVGGTSPGTQHDVLQMTGMATLHGRLEMPFISGFTPTSGQSITYIQANSVVGRYDSVSFPNITASLAADLVFLPSTAQVNFVAPLTVAFNSGNLLPPPGPNHWGNLNFWAGQLPDSKSVVDVLNQQPTDRVLELNASLEGSDDVIVHQASLGGTTSNMTLRVPGETNFTAVYQMNINNRGTLALAGGTVHSNLVSVNPGGELLGNGFIAGDVQLGTTTGTLQATLSPGFSAGVITIEENLTVEQNGVVEIEIFASNDFDTVIVGEDANLGGTLMVDMTGVVPASIIGNEFVVITAGDVNQQFGDIDTLGAPDYFFQPAYSEFDVSLLLYGDGDMNCDGDYTSIDVEKFATALTNPIAYFSEFEIFGEDSGDMNDDGFFDFDDIEQFSQISFSNITAAEVIDYLLEFTTPAVPEPSAVLLMVAGSALLTGTAGRVLRNRSSIPS